MKAICFSTDTGGGHNTAARAVAEALCREGADARRVDCLSFIGKNASRIVGETYVSVARNFPKFFGGIYQAGAAISTPKRKSPVYMANSLYREKMAEFIKAEKPDILVCAHIFAAQTLTSLMGEIEMPLTAGVMTDYTCAPFWEEVNMDVYYIPHAALTKEYVRKGVEEGKLAVTGIPVSPDCVPCKDVRAAKANLNYDPDRPHILVVGGSMGAGRLPEVTRMLVKSMPEVQISVVCGSNLEAHRHIEREQFDNSNVRVYGQVRPLFGLMDASDVVVTKPGGLTTTELFTKRLPVVLMNPIVGVETLNAEFFEREGAAMYARVPEEIAPMARMLVNGEGARSDMRKAQEKFTSGRASADIARDLIARAEARA